MAKLIPKGSLEPLTEAELATADEDERHAEAWYLICTGHTQRDVARKFDVTPTTIRNWTDKYARARRSRSENIEVETERIVGQMEAVANKAWEMAGRLPDNSMAGPSYLKTIIEAAQVIARLKGIDGSKTDASGGSKTTVVVRFGGQGPQPSREGFIDVGVLEETG